MARSDVDGIRPSELAELQEVLRIFLESELQDLSLEYGEIRLSVTKGRSAPPAPTAPTAPTVHQPAPATPVPAPVAEPAPERRAPEPQPGGTPEPEVPTTEGDVDVLSPSGGLFYRCPAPGEPPFVEVGDHVEVGDTLCLIEIMKMFTEIRAEVPGTVVAIFPDSEDVVSEGGVLMTIRPEEVVG